MPAAQAPGFAISVERDHTPNHHANIGNHLVDGHKGAQPLAVESSEAFEEVEEEPNASLRLQPVKVPSSSHQQNSERIDQVNSASNLQNHLTLQLRSNSSRNADEGSGERQYSPGATPHILGEQNIDNTLSDVPKS